MKSALTSERHRKNLLAALAFLAPNFVGFLTFTAFPVVFSLAMSFTNWSLKPSVEQEFVGLRNYRDLLWFRPIEGVASAGAASLIGWLVCLVGVIVGLIGTVLSGERARGLKAGGALWLATGVCLLTGYLLGLVSGGYALASVILIVLGWVLISHESATWMGSSAAWPVAAWAGLVGLALLSSSAWQGYELNDRYFWFYFYNTFYFMLGMPVGIAGSLILAVVLSKPLNLGRLPTRIVLAIVLSVAGLVTASAAWSSGRKDLALLLAVVFGVSVVGALAGNVAFRTIFYIPNFTAGVALLILWSQLYNPHFGLVNSTIDQGIRAVRSASASAPSALFFSIAGMVWLIGAGLIIYWIWRLVTTVRHDGVEAVIGHVLKMAVVFWLFLKAGGVFVAWAGAEQLEVTLPQWLGSTRSLLGFLSLPDYFSNKGFGLGAREAIMIMGIWTGIGGNTMLLYLAGISNVPPELYEAAEIDGAGRWARFRHVTWPQLAPTTFFVVIMATIGGLQGGFEQARVMTLGGPAGTTTTLAYYIYTAAFEQLNMGYASAVAWVMFALIFGLTLINWRFGNRYVNY